MIKKILTIFFVLFFFVKADSQIKNKINIIVKIDNQAITNVDIKNEIKYLIAINNQLEEVKFDELKKFAKDSLIKEIIKKKELLNYYVLDQKSEFLDNYIDNFFKKLNINNKEELELYLLKYDLSLDEVTKKFEIEVIWNEYIFTKYKDQVKVDVEKLKEKIENTQIKSDAYLLSEILYQVKNKNEIKSKYNEILNSVREIEFKNTANIFSVSDTSKYGGDIGWINERQLSKNINKNIKNLNKGEISQPIIVPGGILILKINDKKIENVEINKDEELKNLIAFEKNKQFNQ
ncbi:peptidylprolyl isomerase, partial [Candidatus Pelagibacter bacterium]|nr:peptidylprolyl isomerase [Candidatus Pelagibacter bacterium]